MLTIFTTLWKKLLESRKSLLVAMIIVWGNFSPALFFFSFTLCLTLLICVWNRSKPFWRADVRVVEITDFLLYFQKGDQYFGLGNTFTGFEGYRWVLKLTIVVDRNSTDSTQVPGLKNGQYHRYQFNYVGTSHKLLVWSSARNTME